MALERVRNIKKEPKVILLPLEDSYEAHILIPPVKEFADIIKAHIHILYVCGEQIPESELMKKLQIDQKELSEFSINIQCGNFSKIVLKETLNADYLVMYINEKDFDGIAISRGLAEILKGSEIPVLLLRSDMTFKKDGEWKPKKILVPLDGNPESAQSLRPSIELIKNVEAEVDVLHIFSSEEKNIKDNSLTAPYYEDAPHQEWQTWSKEFLKRFLPSLLESTNVKLFLSKGDPAQFIIDFIKENKNDLIIMAWKGKLSPHHAKILKRIICEGACPILLTRIVAEPKNKPLPEILV